MARQAHRQQERTLSAEAKIRCAFYDAFYRTYCGGLESYPAGISDHLNTLWQDALRTHDTAAGITASKGAAGYALRIAKNHTLLERMAEKGEYDTGLAAMLLADIQYNIYRIRSMKG